MPIINANKGILRTDIANVPESEELPEHSWGETLGAAFEQENTIGSMISTSGNPNVMDTPNNMYNAYGEDDILDFSNQEQMFLGESTNKEGYEFNKRKLAKEKKNRQILAESGGQGMASMLAAGLVDPVNFIPVAGFGYKAYRTGSILKNARNLAITGAVTSSASEAVLHSNQELRTKTETALIVGGSTILSGVMGGGLAYLGRGRAQELSRAIDNELENAAPQHNSVGAAATDDIGYIPVEGTTLEQEQLLSALGLERMNVSAMQRTANSPELLTRQFAERLVEQPYYKQKHLEGVASQVSVSGRIDDWNSVIVQSELKLREQFKKFSLRMRNESGEMLSRDDFYSEVGRAARNNDIHVIPEIETAAKAYRQKIFDPMLKQLEKHELLPEGVNISTGKSYLSRIYKREAIKANRTRFQSIIEQHLIRSDPENIDISDAYLIAEDVVEHILGSPLGKVKLGRDIVTRAGSLKERTLNIPEELIDDFIVHDVAAIAQRYVKSVAPELEMKRAGFSRDLTDELEQVHNSYKDKIEAAGTDMKAVKKLEKDLNSDLKDLRQMRDELHGTFGRANDPDSAWSQGFRTVKKVNFVAMLGQATVSATADMANPILQWGFRRYIPALVKMSTSMKAIKMAKADMQKMSVGLDMVQSGRARALAQLDGIDDKLDTLAGNFSKIMLMDQWNSFHKQFTGVMNMDTLLKNSGDMVNGNLKPRYLKKMARSGIDSEMAARIQQQFTRFGQTENKLRIANIGDWDDAQAALVFRVAVRKNVDWTINTPKESMLPTWMKSETGGVIGQFKSFIFAAHQQTLIPALQAHDRAALSGGIMSIGLGAVAMTLKHKLSGREVPQDAGTFLIESIDAAGPMSVMMEMNNIADKVTDHKYSLQALFGGNEAQRYSSRSKVGALMGPTFGQAENAFQIMGDVFGGEVDRSTIGKARKFMPMQNVFYLRNTIDSIEESFGDALGLEGKRKPFTKFKENFDK